jgi:hypothetical protein
MNLPQSTEASALAAWFTHYLETLHRFVAAQHGCMCSHTGTFFVKEVIEGEATNVAVEIFQLTEHPEASQAFAWAWNDNGTTAYMTVLRVPSTDSPWVALQAWDASRKRALSVRAHSLGTAMCPPAFISAQ